MVLCSPSNFPKRSAETGRGTAEAKVKKVSSPEELRQGYAEVPGIWVERCEMWVIPGWPLTPFLCHFFSIKLRMEGFGQVMFQRWIVKVGWSWLPRDFQELGNWSCPYCLGFKHVVFDFQWAYNACKATEGQRSHSFFQHWCLGCW